MALKNSTTRYGSVSQWLHWLMALAIFGLFGLGYWMVGLDYYSTWYQKGPRLHESIGLIVLVVLAIRLIWKFINPSPSLSDLAAWEQQAASIAHWTLYALMAVVLVSGYLISTGGGKPVSMFDFATIPSIISGDKLVDQAGTVHEYASWALIYLAGIHTIAAIKHHFLDKNDTLRRMLPGADKP